MDTSKAHTAPHGTSRLPSLGRRPGTGVAVPACCLPRAVLTRGRQERPLAGTRHRTIPQPISSIVYK